LIFVIVIVIVVRCRGSKAQPTYDKARDDDIADSVELPATTTGDYGNVSLGT
jgi:hypothetical protein